MNTTASGRGHPEPRRRHRRGSRLGYLHIRVLLGELRRWQRQASKYDLNLSEFVRTRMNNGKVRVSIVADPALLHELRRHGSNLNQLMHAINAGYFVNPARVETVLNALQALYRREIERG